MRPERIYYVYFIQAGKGAIKVGVSDDPGKRLECLQVGNHKKLRLIGKIVFYKKSDAYGFEKMIHERFYYLSMRGEWFKRRILKEFPERTKAFPHIFNGTNKTFYSYLENEAPPVRLGEKQIKKLQDKFLTKTQKQEIKNKNRKKFSKKHDEKNTL